MCATNVKVIEKRQRSSKLSVERRHQRLITLYHTVKRFSVGKAAAALGVSYWTVKRDLDFLREHDLLAIKRFRCSPFDRCATDLQESGEDFMRRFQAAHRA